MQINSRERRSEIDFLRGIAILFVLFRHYKYNTYLQEMGWIGVDLFFVLSGFLVSGLLFKEYKHTNAIRPFRFLIRRGFKIYPVFYLFILFTIFWKMKNQEEIKTSKLLGELFFLQNYVGSMWSHTWSLAVEEHFYLFLTAFIYITTKLKLTDNTKFFNYFFGIIAIYSVAFRIFNSQSPYLVSNMYQSHLRFDSLLMGVLISHWYHFKQQEVKTYVTKNKKKLLALFFLCILFTPFITVKFSVFIPTIGLTLLYIGFGALLLWSLYTDIHQFFSKNSTGRLLYAGVCKIGMYSYSIYIVHVAVSVIIKSLKNSYTIQPDISFLIYVSTCLAIGILLSKLIEFPFLKIRDKYFPANSPPSL